ncbi:HD domain-containing phosphohydrolase [Andreprevotia chitinilytica]|uniref:HD domain-containing phosphohydrolase n=1 Tax=Andreprevotia chitinilytica TaxID=396808 RepID=UPI000552905E|nr:HD domain-containing phosphohydrolase [Andreprevotia chitinilytica]
MPKQRDGSGKHRRYPLYAYISILFVALLVVFALVNIVYQYRQTSRMLLTASGALFSRIGDQTVRELERRYTPTSTVVNLLSHQGVMEAGSLYERLHSFPYFAEILRGSLGLASVYIGYDNGDFFLVRRLDQSPALREHFNAPDGAMYMVQSVERHGADVDGRYLFYNSSLRMIEQRSEPTYQFDPRQRPWYVAASTQRDVSFTRPYLFFTVKEVGTTISRRSENSEAVVAADITLDSLSNLLAAQRITPNSELALFDDQRQVLAYRDPARVMLQTQSGAQLRQLDDLHVPALSQLVEAAKAGNSMPTFDSGGIAWQGYLATIPVPGGTPMHLAIAAPQSELLSDAINVRNRAMEISAGMLIIAIAIALWVSRLASQPIKALLEEAKQIQALQFDSTLTVRSRIEEIDELAQAMGTAKATIRNFLDIGMALASERRFDSLIARILEETADISHGRGGVVYLQEESGLKPVQARWGEQAFDGNKLATLIGGRDDTHPAMQAYLYGNTVSESFSPAELTERFDHVSEFDHPLTVLAVPLKNQLNECLGVLLLLQDEEEYLVNASLIALVEALSGSAAIAIEAQQLVLEQKHLLEAFIQLIAGAIDAKSPYTGGHCQRVPELTKMLARAAEREIEGPYADFNPTLDEWEALHIAAWLHDCGKVTTPEYVVDKATKLETLYDRIHEVRMRFEVLKRDAELSYWQAVAVGGDPAVLKTILDQQLRRLDDDFAFIGECNLGGEFMAPERVERLKTIAAKTWRRTISDRIGISYEEAERKARAPESLLPVDEPLLVDRPEHLFMRGPHDVLPAGYGFDMKEPEYLYNRGELYNLAVARGTLSAEERYKINQHIVQTIVMLEKLPFPKHLQQVPEIAGGHHEKMDGNGYPKRLRGGDMSLPARMMAIADIFEALTAIDRPYKKGKMLSESLKIMASMAREGHVDPGLFRLFIRQKVYLEYAERFMRQQQVDVVDEQALLAGLA